MRVRAPRPHSHLTRAGRPPLVQPAATVRSSPTLSGVPPRPACVLDLVLGPMENLSATCQCGLFGQTGVMRRRLPPCFKFHHCCFAHPNFVLDMKKNIVLHVYMLHFLCILLLFSKLFSYYHLDLQFGVEDMRDGKVR